MTHELPSIDIPLTPEQKAKLERASKMLIKEASNALIPAHGVCLTQKPKNVEVNIRGFVENDIFSAFLVAHTVCPTVVKNRCYTRYVFNSASGKWEQPESNKS